RMDLAENEAGLRFEDGALVELLAPGSRQLYWKGQSAQTLQRIDLSQTYRLDTSLVAQLNQPKLRGRSLAGLEAVLLSAVPAFHVGVLKVDGVVEELLGAGQYGFWRFNR
ncbi:slipin family protein, partial [Pseudomonas frederiksbergensis]|nr:slipin family protein [Pseudomonas frederiksbergensis]